MWNLAVRLKEQKVDWVNLQYVPHLFSSRGLSCSVALLPLFIRIQGGPRVVTTCHELLPHRPKGLYVRLLGLAYQIQAFFILFGSDRVIVPVVWQEQRLRESFPWWKGKIRRIPVGPSIGPNSSSALPQDSASLTLATFGTGHPWWQYEKALEILRGLLDRGIPARLICLGDIAGTNPPYYKRLLHKSAELHLENSVEWTGRLEEQGLSHRLQSADLFLALQKAGVTARSTALISALAHGLAVIATDGPDADRWLLESDAMAVVPPNDFAALLETTVRLVQDVYGRRALGERARALYQREFSWEKISDKFLKALT